MGLRRRQPETANKFRRMSATLTLFTLISGSAPVGARAQERNAGGPYPVKRPESREQWYRDGRRVVEAAKRLRAQPGRAKQEQNVIFYVMMEALRMPPTRLRR
jgi:hypothetical protein